MEGWTIEDVCTFVKGLSQEFGDQASVYAAAMKEKAVDGKALLDLSAANNPIADNKVKELGLTKMGPRRKLQRRIEDTHASEERPGRSLVVGNPLPNRLGGLAGADEEAHLVVGLLRRVGVEVDALMRGAADKAAVLKKIQGAAWAHFACHGDMDAHSLVLAAHRGGAHGGTEADLSKEEVQGRVRMRAGSTAVLSACNTFRGVIKAEGVIGLARAFLFACVAAIVVSLWSVSAASRHAAPRAHIAHPRGSCCMVRSEHAPDAPMTHRPCAGLVMMMSC